MKRVTDHQQRLFESHLLDLSDGDGGADSSTVIDAATLALQRLVARRCATRSEVEGPGPTVK